MGELIKNDVVGCDSYMIYLESPYMIYLESLLRTIILDEGLIGDYLDICAAMRIVAHCYPLLSTDFKVVTLWSTAIHCCPPTSRLKPNPAPWYSDKSW